MLARAINENGPLAEILAIQMIARLLKGDLRVFKLLAEHDAAEERERARRRS